MRFEEWTLNTSDNKTLHGVTEYAFSEKQSEKVLVLVHGLTGHKDEYHIKGSANFFRDKGYDVVRFNLYHGENGRRLRDTTLPNLKWQQLYHYGIRLLIYHDDLK